MASEMYGADSDQLEQLARRLESSVDELGGLLTSGVGDVALATLGAGLSMLWRGPRAQDFANIWQSRHLAALRQLERMLNEAAKAARSNALEQRNASVANLTTSPRGEVYVEFANGNECSVAANDALAEIHGILDSPPNMFDPDQFHSELDRIQDLLRDLSPAERRVVMLNLSDSEWAMLYDQMTESQALGGYSATDVHTFLGLFVPYMSTTEVRRFFGDDWARASEHGRHVGADSTQSFSSSFFHYIADGDESGYLIQPDEIEIRMLDNGRYVVVLPGINLPDWNNVPGHHESGSVRTLRNAAAADWSGANASTTGANPYGFAVKEALRHAGVPDGAEVMMVGHSHGAYTALDLAADQSFNDLAAGSEIDGYSVKVTHVLAGAADAGNNMARVPDTVEAHLVNNTNDAIRLGEDASQIESFDGRTTSFSGAVGLDGHDSGEYGKYMDNPHDPANRGTNLDQLDAMIESAETKYNDEGNRIRVKVKDPYVPKS